MDRDDALETVSAITVSATEKRQLEQYEPATASVEVRAVVGPNDDIEELRAALNEYVREKAKAEILARYEEYVRQEIDE